MHFLKYMEACKGDPRVYASVDGKCNLWHEGNTMHIYVPPELKDVMRDAEFFECLEFYITCKVYGGGPKVFKPTAEQLRLLAEMQLNVPYAEYAQPFQTVVIEYPSDFCATHVVENPANNGPQPLQKPLFSILHHTGPYIVHGLYMDSMTTMKAWWHPDPALELEDWMLATTDPKASQTLVTNRPTQEWTPVEQDLECECRRIALAYCLLLDEVGIKKQGPMQPKRYEAWRKSAEKRPELGTRSFMRVHPFYYELKQEVVLHRTVSSHSELGESDRTMPPHHRRGHYRMQRYGPGLQQVKRVRILPVFVNKHLFLGSMADATATYKERS